MAVNTQDWEGINRCLTRLYRELNSQRFPRMMLELLGELVPMDSAAVNFFCPPGQLTAVIIPDDTATAEQISLVGHYAYQSPFGYYLATQDASWKRATDFMPVADVHMLDLHRLAVAPLGVHYQTARSPPSSALARARWKSMWQESWPNSRWKTGPRRFWRRWHFMHK